MTNNVNLLEQTAELSQPVELYEFNYGVDTYNYCTGGENIVVKGRFYKAISVLRESFNVTENLLKSSLKLEIQADCEVGALALQGLTERKLNVKAYKADPNIEGEKYLYFSGQVAAFEINELSVKFEIFPPNTTLQTNGFTPKYQRMCRHRLYSKFCRLNKEDYTEKLVVEAVSNNVVVVRAWGSTEQSGREKRFVFGQIEFNGTGAQIVKAKDLETESSTFSYGGVSHYFEDLDFSDYFTVNFFGNEVRTERAYALGLRKPIKGLSVGDEVFVSWGCDQTSETCRVRFENVENFGGFEHIPNKNPFAGVRVF